jgi:hypothetical protein
MLPPNPVLLSAKSFLDVKKHPMVAAAAEPAAASGPAPTGFDLYSRFAFAGAVCCSVTHGALTPVDVVS